MDIDWDEVGSRKLHHVKEIIDSDGHAPSALALREEGVRRARQFRNPVSMVSLDLE